MTSSDTRAPSDRFGYVVLSHRRPERVEALVRRIRDLSPGSAVLVRHDRGADPLDVDRLRGLGAHVMVGTHAVRWGAWSLVTAALEGFEELRSRERPDWYVLVSGQDWPTAHLPAWESRLSVARRTEGVQAQVHAAALDRSSRAVRIGHQDQILSRYTHTWYHLPRLPMRHRLPPLLVRAVRAAWYRTLGDLRLPVLLNRLPRDLGWMIGLPRLTRSRPPEQLWKGDQWVAVSAEGLRRLLAARDQPASRRRWRNTLIPDESFVPTVLFGGADPVPGALAPVTWTAFSGSDPHPAELDVETARRAFAAGTPFARKLGDDEDVAAVVRRVLDGV